MKSRKNSLWLAVALVGGWFCGGQVWAQVPENIKAAQKLTADLNAAEKAYQAAVAAQLAAEIDLPAKIKIAQAAAEKALATKEKAAKAGPDEKEAALKVAELAQIAADKADKARAAAEKNLPERIEAARKAKEKWAPALAAAEKVVAETKAAQRSAESVLADKTLVAKNAAFAAAVAKQKADKVVQANAGLHKAVAAMAAAEKARAEKTLALQKAKEDLQDKTRAALEAANKVAEAKGKADKAGPKEKDASLKAVKAAQQAAAKAEAAKAGAAKVLSQRTGEAEKAGKLLAATQQTAMRTILQVADAKKIVEVDLQAIAAKAAQADKDNEAAAQEAAQVQLEADKTETVRAEAEKIAAQRTAVREALERAIRERFYRDLTAAQMEVSKIEQGVSDKVLQPSIVALAKATEAYQNAREEAEEAASALAAAITALQKAPAQDKKAAEKLVKQREAVAKATEEKVAVAKVVRDRAREEKAAAELKVSLDEKLIEALTRAAYTKLAVAKAAAQGGLKPLADAAWDHAKARHLLVRAGFGGTPDEVARLQAMGLHRAVDYLVNYKKNTSADLSFTAYPKERPLAWEKKLPGNEQARINARRQKKEAQQIQDMRTGWLRRMIESRRPLEEKLTLFWHNHFATQYSDVADSYYMFLQNKLFRDHAAGNFASLLHGITHDAAMLKYLNNDTNVKGRANENLAREIMELFGMGRDQGYGEIDIRQGARALTGYTYDTWTGQFRFVESRHDPEPKTIFGKTGNWCGDDFAALILDTPYPAKFIARQMLVFFVHEDPSLDTIEALANVLRLNNYELAPMLENMFASEEFYCPKAMGTQIKGPIQLLVGLHRDLGLKDADLPYLVKAAADMGQLLFEPPNVFGWPAGRAWINSTRVFTRYNALADIMETVPRAGKTGVDVVGTLLAGKKLQTHAEVVDYLVRCCLSVPLSETKRQALIEFLNPLPPPASWQTQPGPANARLTRLLAILMCTPEFQLT